MWEYKFVFKDDRLAGSFFHMIKAMKNFAGYQCCVEKKVTNDDVYFDTSELKLELQGMTCRARKCEQKDECTLTLKREALGPNREATFQKTDLATFSRDQFDNVRKGNFPENIRTYCGSSQEETNWNG